LMWPQGIEVSLLEGEFSLALAKPILGIPALVVSVPLA